MMAVGTPLHASQFSSELKRNPFSMRFEDPKLEAAWEVDRLATFWRVNKRAALVFLGICVAFIAVDLLLLWYSVEVLLPRLGFVAFGIACYYVVGRIPTFRMGDWIVFVSMAVALTVVWFAVFLKLPSDMVNAYWLITGALFAVGIFVLFEMSLPSRIGLSFLILVHSLAACAQLDLTLEDSLLGALHLVIVIAIGWVAAWQVEWSRRLAFVRLLGVEHEKARTVDLLRNILPRPIADQLLSSIGTIAERHSDVAVLFADIVGFTHLASHLEAERVVQVLDQVFTEFDQLCDQHGVEKIKTIGDAYMAAGGVPDGQGAQLDSVVALALDMLDAVEAVPADLDGSLQLRIGIHRGPAVAGVIGRRKFIYDLWGDTVNMASRMESHGLPGRVQVTETIAEQLGDGFALESRGAIEVKGKGSMNTCFVDRRDGAATGGPAPVSVG